MQYQNEPIESGFDFWLKAAEWGSYMTSGDPGAVMYGFDERGVMQSEEHRANVIAWCENCKKHATKAGKRELDFLIEYAKKASLGS